MPGPWEHYAPAAAAEQGPWANYASTPAPEKPAYSGSILPLSKDAKGNVSFDSNAGILGSLKRAFTLPGEVQSGAVPVAGEDGHTSPQLIGRAAEMASVATPANPAMRAGDALLPGVAKAVTREKPPVPSTEALKDAATAGYDKARGMGVDIRGSAVGDMARGVQSALEQDGVIAELAPKTFSILSKITRPPEGSIATLSNIDAVRRALGHAAGDFTNKTEQMAAKRAIEHLDDFVSKMPPEAVLAGPAAEAGKVLEGARGNYAAAMRSNKITGDLDNAVTGAVERGNLNAAVANSGQNLDNNTRQRIASLLKSKREVAGYNPEELGALSGVAKGSLGANTLRTVGGAMGGSMGREATGPILAGIISAIATGNPALAAISGAPIVGMGLKRAGAAMTRGGLNKADELIRSRSPLHQEAVANAPNVPISAEKRAALIRALMLSAQPQQ